MNKDNEFASDSDESDDDFCPDKLTEENSDELSEEESDEDNISDLEQVDVKPKTRNGRRKKQNHSKRKRIDNSTESIVKNNDTSKSCNLRKTRQNENLNGEGKKSLEKDELESDDEEKTRTNTLWADFLNDVTSNASNPKTKPEITSTATKPKTKPENKTCSLLPNKSLTTPIIKTSQVQIEKSQETGPKEVVVTEVLNFAGEDIQIQKTIKCDSVKENKRSSTASGSGLSISSIKRPASSSGSSGAIGSILNQLGKKKKISVLEKTKLDWNDFKETEGIKEDLQSFNKGKDGYLERQDFLQRTDVRQFEIEKKLRQSKRNC